MNKAFKVTGFKKHLKRWKKFGKGSDGENDGKGSDRVQGCGS